MNRLGPPPARKEVMPSDIPDLPNLSKAQWRDISETLTAPPQSSDPLLPHLELLADLLADAGSLPREPVLVWREPNQQVRHAAIGSRLVVGRHADAASLALPEDKLLSRAHFAVRPVEEGCELEDLRSRNGTAVNTSENRVRRRLLRDGDLILAGEHIFAFLDQRRMRVSPNGV